MTSLQQHVPPTPCLHPTVDLPYTVEAVAASLLALPLLLPLVASLQCSCCQYIGDRLHPPLHACSSHTPSTLPALQVL